MDIPRTQRSRAAFKFLPDQTFKCLKDFLELFEEYCRNNSQVFTIYNYKHDQNEYNFIHYKCYHHNKTHPSIKAKNCPAKIKISYRKKGNIKNMYQISEICMTHNHPCLNEVCEDIRFKMDFSKLSLIPTEIASGQGDLISTQYMTQLPMSTSDDLPEFNNLDIRDDLSDIITSTQPEPSDISIIKQIDINDISEDQKSINFGSDADETDKSEQVNFITTQIAECLLQKSFEPSQLNERIQILYLINEIWKNDGDFIIQVLPKPNSVNLTESDIDI